MTERPYPPRAPARVAAPVPPPAMGAGSPAAALAKLPPELFTEPPGGVARGHCPRYGGSLNRRGGPGFRRFVDGRSPCVVLASAGEQQAARIAGQGRPDPEALQRCLAPLLGPGCEL